MAIALLLGVVLLVVWLHLPVQAVVWLLVLAGAWWVSLKLWPEKTCRQCSGSGVRPGPFTMVRRCGPCRGRGTLPRIGSGQ